MTTKYAVYFLVSFYFLFYPFDLCCCSFFGIFPPTKLAMTAKEALCLFGHPNGLWEVAEPPELIPLGLPDPVLGINYVRDGMNRTDWLSWITVHSDCWLLSMAFFYPGYRLNREERYDGLGVVVLSITM